LQDVQLAAFGGNSGGLEALCKGDVAPCVLLCDQIDGVMPISAAGPSRPMTVSPPPRAEQADPILQHPAVLGLRQFALLSVGTDVSDLKAAAAGLRSPVVMLSANALPSHLSKPLTARSLIDALASRALVPGPEFGP
jgi:hypothetical protein